MIKKLALGIYVLCLSASYAQTTGVSAWDRLPVSNHIEDRR